jgi:hypothetical protein
MSRPRRATARAVLRRDTDRRESGRWSALGHGLGVVPGPLAPALARDRARGTQQVRHDRCTRLAMGGTALALGSFPGAVLVVVAPVALFFMAINQLSNATY